MLAVWAETGLILADEFRDGNVPAMMSPLTAAKAAFCALPPTVETFYYRGDSASHEHELMDWLRNAERPDGPKGRIGFAISARMTDALQKAIDTVGENQWQILKEESDAIRSCAEVAFVPSERNEKKDSQPLRYIAIRIEKKQGHLYDDGSRVRHFAVVTNIEEWSAGKLIQWHREKAGTVEMVHDVLKNELAAGVLPCGRFGANAAWLRLAVIAHNVLTALKRLAYPHDPSGCVLYFSTWPAGWCIMRAQWSCGWRRCCSELPTWSTHLKSCPSLSNRFSNHRKLVSLKLYRLPHWLGEVLNPAPARRHQGKRCHERIWCLSDKKFATHLARLAGLRCRSAPYQRIEVGRSRRRIIRISRGRPSRLETCLGILPKRRSRITCLTRMGTCFSAPNMIGCRTVGPMSKAVRRRGGRRTSPIM